MGAAAPCLRGDDKQFIDQLNRLGVNFSQDLSNQSVRFLHTLWRNAPYPFEQVLTKLGQYSLMLTACHVDKIISLLHSQRALPETIVVSLDKHLTLHPAFETNINALLITNAPELLSSAVKHQLIHHSLPHALEISIRARKVMDKMGVLTKNDVISRFLRAVINVMVQFHDLEQQDKGIYNSVEEATAARVSCWIKTSMSLSDEPELNLLVDFIVDHIIVLGTTTIYSLTRTMDLSELFLELKSVAICAGWLTNDALSVDLPINPDSKAGLIHCMDAVMLLVGICDKNPTAIYDVVVQQEEDKAISTLFLMKDYFKTPLYIEQFFTQGGFSHVFNKGSTDAINQQAFFMAVIPHLCMRAELCAVERQVNANQFMHLISLVRAARASILDNDAFMRWFNSVCRKHDMNRVMSAIFFECIDSEINFCKSQERGLVFVANKLIAMRFSPKSPAGAASGHFEPLINSQVPVGDANNLRALGIFYDSLNESGQEALTRELLFAVIMQAGEMYAKKSGLTEDLSFMSEIVARQPEDLRFFMPSGKKRVTEPSIDSDVAHVGCFSTKTT